MASKKNKRKPEHRTPSPTLLSAHQQTGGGAHQESRAERNKRTGRLNGAEKRNLSHHDK